mmetsp:Transcript_19786/g.41813  ORF Transcript_19786/g.41813 Transcript_19786/m.41813 type:complete len:242 (+) Transcript_19786:2559-3284(+)
MANASAQVVLVRDRLGLVRPVLLLVNVPNVGLWGVRVRDDEVRLQRALPDLVDLARVEDVLLVANEGRPVVLVEGRQALRRRHPRLDDVHARYDQLLRLVLRALQAVVQVVLRLPLAILNHRPPPGGERGPVLLVAREEVVDVGDQRLPLVIHPPVLVQLHHGASPSRRRVASDLRPEKRSLRGPLPVTDVHGCVPSPNLLAYQVRGGKKRALSLSFSSLSSLGKTHGNESVPGARARAKR